MYVEVHCSFIYNSKNYKNWRPLKDGAKGQWVTDYFQLLKQTDSVCVC